MFIDFGYCTQTLFPGEDHAEDDFAAGIRLFVYEASLPREFVSKVYGRRDVFDRWGTVIPMELERLYHEPEWPLLDMFDFESPPLERREN